MAELPVLQECGRLSSGLLVHRGEPFCLLPVVLPATTPPHSQRNCLLLEVTRIRIVSCHAPYSTPSGEFLEFLHSLSKVHSFIGAAVAKGHFFPQLQLAHSPKNNTKQKCPPLPEYFFWAQVWP